MKPFIAVIKYALLPALFMAALISQGQTSDQTFKITPGNMLEKDQFNDIGIGFNNFIKQEMDEGRPKFNHFIDSKNKTIYLGIARDENKQYRFGVLKNYTTLVDSKVMQLEVPGMEGATYYFLKMAEISGKRFTFYETGRGEENALYVNQMDENFVLLGSPIKLMEQTRKFQSTSIHLSDDKKSILIFQSGVGSLDKKAAGTSRENPKLLCTMLDDQFGQVWQTEFELPFRTKDGAVSQVSIDNARNMYVLTDSGEGKYESATLYQYYWNSKQWKSTLVGSDYLGTYGCRLEILKGTTPVVAGLVAMTGRRGAYFITVVDPAAQTATEITNKIFGPDFWEWDGFVSPLFFGVSNIATTDNGNITISVEGGIRHTVNASINYLFSPVFVAQVDGSGKDVWQRVINKKQSMVWLPNSGGHAMFTKDNDIIILYNDNADNIKRALVDKRVKDYHRRCKSVLFAQKIDTSGKAVREMVATGLDDDHSIDPRYMLPLGNNLYLTESWAAKGVANGWSYAYTTVELR